MAPAAASPSKFASVPRWQHRRRRAKRRQRHPIHPRRFERRRGERSAALSDETTEERNRYMMKSTRAVASLLTLGTVAVGLLASKPAVAGSVRCLVKAPETTTVSTEQQNLRKIDYCG